PRLQTPAPPGRRTTHPSKPEGARGDNRPESPIRRIDLMGPGPGCRHRRRFLWPTVGLVLLGLLGAGEPPGSPPSGVQTPPALPDPNPRPSVRAEPSPAADALGTPLVPGQVIQPIDLAGALRLAGARDLDVAIARQRVGQALAELEQARVQWLPSLFVGAGWFRHDGQ